MSTPKMMFKPSIKYMDYDFVELAAAAFNWCEESADRLEEDANNPCVREDRECLLEWAKNCREAKELIAQAVKLIDPGEMERVNEYEVNTCMAL